MKKNFRIIVPEIKGRVRIDKYLTNLIENASRTKVQKSINLGNVIVNGNLVKSNYIVKPSDEIEIELPVPEKQEILAENIPLDIVYEDQYLLIVNKPAGMVTHPAYKNYSGTLVNALLYYSQQKNDKLSDLNGFERAGIVHRLDKDTSGLLVVAKDEVTHRKLSELFFHHKIKREYQGIVWGRLRQKRGTIEAKLTRDRRDRKKITVVRDEAEEGKLAITEYEVLEEYDFLSLIRFNLKTGRTHQIRVHLSSIGHPIFGDETYGGRKPHGVTLTNSLRNKINNLLYILPRQALHAKMLGFIHPHYGKEMIFETELPEDMKKLLNEIRKN